MKKTINANLNGRAFTIDEDAYVMLENYLQNLKIHFRKEDGADEIIADFEARIQELLTEYVEKGSWVISIHQVEEVIARVGKPADFSESEKEEKKTFSAPTPETSEKRRKFYRNGDDKIISGICSGVSAYFGWDVLAVRIIAVVLLFFTGFWIIPVYLVVWLIVPEARTAEEKLRMQGRSVTVENIGRTVAEEVRPVKQEDSGLSRLVGCIGGFLKICFFVILGIIALPLFVTLIALIIAFFAVLFGIGTGFAGLLPFEIAGISDFISAPHPMITTVSLFLIIFIPLAVIVYGIISWIARWKPVHAGIKWAGFLLWMIAIIAFLCSGIRINRNADFIDWGWEYFVDGKRVEIGGSQTSRIFRLPLSEKIELGKVPATLYIQQIPDDGTDSMEIQMSGYTNVLDEIRYSYSDNRLIFYPDDDVYFIRRHHKNNIVNDSVLTTDDKIVILVKTPSLKRIRLKSHGSIEIPEKLSADSLAIELQGTGKVVANDLTVRALRVSAIGTGKIDVKGKASKAFLKMNGVGAINAGQLIADTVYAEMNGVGKIRCFPVRLLDAEMDGVGEIIYLNEPENKVLDRRGLGKIWKE
jgi:phage shock protein PspC (stress-responsive transcriptional regulator)